jgi:signal transduction histidine kinase
LTQFIHNTTIDQDIEAISRIPVINSILEVVCRSTGMGFAAVARVTDTKWVACAVRDEIDFGLKPGGELVLETTICHEIRQNEQAVIIDHVAEDPLFANHHTPLQYGFQSYISIPIKRKDGSFFGTLCSIDPNPNKLNTPETIGMFTLFADLISQHLANLDDLTETAAQLIEERKTAELREQFIAILGHDLRNPISAVSNVSQLLMRMPLDERVMRLANILKDASFRMKGLIDNVMDFASGRMGGGIVLVKDGNDIEKTVQQVIEELSVIYPESKFETSFNLNDAVNHDGKRIAQYVSNILANALVHGKKNEPVKIAATSNNGLFTLTVTNNGPKIPDTAMERLFQPFARGQAKKGQQGLGLGLYIASQIANAHNGNIEVLSTGEETSFTLRMPAADLV